MCAGKPPISHQRWWVKNMKKHSNYIMSEEKGWKLSFRIHFRCFILTQNYTCCMGTDVKNSAVSSWWNGCRTFPPFLHFLHISTSLLGWSKTQGNVTLFCSHPTRKHFLLHKFTDLKHVASIISHIRAHLRKAILLKTGQTNTAAPF